MKALLLSAIALTLPLAYSSPEMIEPLKEEIPELKENSAKLYKRIHAGFEFKNYLGSPGHQAILSEMRNYYLNLKSFESRLKEATDTFPEKSYKDLTQSQERVDELVDYVVIDEEVKGLIEEWLTDANALVTHKEKLEVIAKRAMEKLKEEVASQKPKSDGGLNQAEIQRANDLFFQRQAAVTNALGRGNTVGISSANGAIRKEYFSPVDWFTTSDGRWLSVNGEVYPLFPQQFRVIPNSAQSNSSGNCTNSPIIRINF